MIIHRDSTPYFWLVLCWTTELFEDKFLFSSFNVPLNWKSYTHFIILRTQCLDLRTRNALMFWKHGRFWTLTFVYYFLPTSCFFSPICLLIGFLTRGLCLMFLNAETETPLTLNSCPWFQHQSVLRITITISFLLLPDWVSEGALTKNCAKHFSKPWL